MLSIKEFLLPRPMANPGNRKHHTITFEIQLPQDGEILDLRTVIEVDEIGSYETIKFWVMGNHDSQHVPVKIAFILNDGMFLNGMKDNYVNTVQIDGITYHVFFYD